jgi:DNA repair exonuclease SbcCD ATPase subunit
MAKDVKMGLAEFHRYLDQTRREVELCYTEVEEVQKQFNDIFKRELEAWQEQFSFCFPRLLAQRDEMPEVLRKHIAQVEAEEQKRIRQEIAELKGKIAANEQRMDALLAGAQETAEALRKANPKLNAREERLKRLITQYEDEYAQAFEELDSLDTFPLGWLTHFGKIRRLKRVQREAKKQQDEAVTKMRKVRQEWLDRVQEAGDTQAELRQEWQALSVATAQAKSELDQKVTAFDALAEQAAIQRVLEELPQAPRGLDGELGEAIQSLVEHNKIRWNYEEGLKAVAEALGLLKGISEGIERFRRSVGTVLQEQRRHNLRAISIAVPASVVAINGIWPDLRARVKDEKQIATRPVEFSRMVKQRLSDRLTDAAIQAYFNDQGEALNRATKAWN